MIEIRGVEYFDTRDLAEIFEVKEATVRQWVSDGDLKAIAERGHDNRKINVYTLEAVQAFAKKKYHMEAP